MMNKEELKARIEKEIEKEINKRGIMGTEVATIKLHLTDEEIELFHDIELDDHYSYDIDGSDIYISYCEAREDKFNLKLQQLLDKKILTYDELEELEEMEEVVQVEDCGMSGIVPSQHYWNVSLENGNEYDIYTEQEGDEN